MTKYDLTIIGSGPGGYVAALYAPRHKLRVLVVEKDMLGGACLNRGCIPTKVMLNSASFLSRIKEFSSYGIDIDGYRLDFQKVISRKDDVVTRLRAGIETLFRANHIDLVKGTARLGSPETVIVDDKTRIDSKNIIIATGSSPIVPPGIKIDNSRVYSSDGILELRDLPESMLVIGGGVIGCEFANIFNAFGVKVTILEFLERLIQTQSREASRKLETIFKKRGIDIFTSSKVEGIECGGHVKAKISGPREVLAEKALVAVGRRSNLEGIGMEDAGVEIENARIVVNDFLETSVKNIYAVGDCVAGPLLAHKASYDGILACDNILGKMRKADYSSIPNCIYTDPEIASVGLNEEDAKKKCPDAKVAKFPYLASGKAYLMGRPEGFIKMIGDAGGNILGIEILGEEACDLIGEAALAKHEGINIKNLSYVVHGHPTLSEIFQEAAHIFCGTGIHSI